ncbi:hypothetical protein BDV96DRAFT_654447 [Lophiotrema nucula]|uniref:Uncharacterized protein n=1 Tax=Lophiotrema nucula TaxID=690887 RepID=A0A6A5YHV7_9PLEO|nr:hypothetical protein BDV96DRAFT_654447 [Lophiotrema nucula]
MASDRPSISSLRRASVDELVMWARENLDLQVIRGAVRASPEKALMEGRGKWLRDHSKYGMIKFFAGGAEWLVYAPLAMQTSAQMKRIMAGYSHDQFPIEYQFDDMEPYVADRIVDFWNSLKVHVHAKKRLEHNTAAPNNPAEADVTQTMTTIETVIEITAASDDLQDDSLRQATLGKLRHYLTEANWSPDELLDPLSRMYSIEGSPHFFRGIRKALLSAFVLNYVEVSSGENAKRCKEILYSNKDLLGDFSKGMAYLQKLG